MDNKENQLIFFLIGFMVLSITGLILFFNNSQQKTKSSTNNSTTSKQENTTNNSTTSKQENTTNNSSNEKTEDKTIKFTEAEKISSSIARDNALGYLNQIDKLVVQKSFEDSYIYTLNGTYIISDNGKKIKSTSNESEVYDIYYTGTYPSEGTLIYDKNAIQAGSSIIVNGFEFEFINGSLVYNENKEN